MQVRAFNDLFTEFKLQSQQAVSRADRGAHLVCLGGRPSNELIALQVSSNN